MLRNPFLLFLLITLIYSCNNNNRDEILERKKNKKKSIVVGDAKFDGPEKYMYYHAAVKHGNINLSEPSIHKQYRPGYKDIELDKALRRIKNNSAFTNRSLTEEDLSFSNYAKDNAVFTERGPYNVPGRTRGLIVDASDPSGNTWITGSIGGGLWKTTDEGVTWNSISNDMDNLAISWIAQSSSKPSTIYVGTGEEWVRNLDAIGGAGIYKSTNSGETWTNISPRDDQGYVNLEFSNISRVIVDPDNSDIVLVSTYGSRNTGSRIYRSDDGGLTWSERYFIASGQSTTGVQQIISAPNDFSIQYAAVNGIGVLRSVDGGISWSNPGGIGLAAGVSYDNADGIIDASAGGSFDRIELAVSHQNPNTVYGAIVGINASYLRVSYDGGTTWNLLRNDDNTEDDWLNNLGWWGNTITLNPFNDSIVYYGSQDAAKARVLPDAGTKFSGTTTKVTFSNSSQYFDLVNIWGGSALGSGTEWADNSENPQIVDVEIRFGTNKTQKAYRFSVPEGSTFGVPHADYTYQDVVEVPFEVWNISADPEEQLTVSFRDNNNDGKFNLVSDYTESREYIFPQNVKYDPNMQQSDINGDGTPENASSTYGQLYKSMYLIWPHLQAGKFWSDVGVPEASIKIESIAADYSTLKKSEQLVTNYYGNGGDATVNRNVHVDHHKFGSIIDSEADSTFRVYLTTDGGVYNTVSGKDPGSNGDFKQAGVTNNSTWFTPAGGYNTTTFYGADKITGVDSYIGGAQDNGTFASLDDPNSSATTNYNYLLGGDGFEVVAHFTDPDKMFGCSQFNYCWYTHDGGSTWRNAGGQFLGNGPFVSRNSTSYQLPDFLVTVDDLGVNISEDFGETWNHTSIAGFGNTFWSGVDVEVSLANPRYIWAGGRMGTTGDIFVSADYGQSFTAVNDFANVGVISGLYSHPTEDSTAYVLFGFKNYAKIIETKDLGQTWNDISGFNGSDFSTTGFPDVAVYSFLVMPHDTNIMWAGTEIGLFESTDRGQSWHKVVSDLPNVNIWDMKIKDQGQVVLSTYGRGIWTATLDDLKSFVPKPVTLPPTILEASQSDREDAYEINLKVDLTSVYDSLEIYANDVNKGTFFDTDPVGERDYMIGVDDFGDYDLKAVGYENGLQYPSKVFEVIVNPVLAPRTEYSTTFSDLVGDEFYLDRFRIGTQGGFEGRQLHTEHPYASAVSQGIGNNQGYSLVAMLNIPIIVTDFTPSIRFNEIAIVETGTSGTSYGDYEFWDYVIVEASKDGSYWKEIVDGYDADAHADWRSAYNSGAFGSPDLIKDRQINFKPHFNEGDTVKVRFRLYSDPLTVGWGWMIDDLYIQKETPVVQGIEYTKLDENISVFPNPTVGEFSIKFNETWRGDVRCQITDIFGRPIYSNILDNRNGSSSHEIDISSRNDGLYLIQLVQGDKKSMFKLIKE